MEKEFRSAVQEVYDTVGRGGSAGPPGLNLTTGRRLAAELGYSETELASIPDAILEAFVGVAPLAGLVQPSPGQRVLDLGCGAGLDSILLRRAGLRVTALELSAPMLQRLRAAAANEPGSPLDCVHSAAPQLPFHSGVFDRVLLNGVANLISARQALLDELARISRPGGLVLFADLVAVAPLPAELREMPEAWAWCVAGAGSPQQWRRELEDSGFEGVEIEILEEIPPLARAVLRAVRCHTDAAAEYRSACESTG